MIFDPESTIAIAESEAAELCKLVADLVEALDDVDLAHPDELDADDVNTFVVAYEGEWRAALVRACEALRTVRNVVKV